MPGWEDGWRGRWHSPGWEVSPFIAGVVMGRVLVPYLPTPAASAL